LTEDFYSPWEIAVQVPVGRKRLAPAIEYLLGEGFAEWFVRSDDSAPAVAFSEQALPVPDLADDATWTAADLASRQLLLGVTSAGKGTYYQD
jgi:hypothetical protein